MSLNEVFSRSLCIDYSYVKTKILSGVQLNRSSIYHFKRERFFT